jgi:hypothetical protein
LKFASAAKFDGVIICGNFNHPTISWTEQGYAFKREQSKCSQTSPKFIDDVGNLNLFQNIRNPTFTSKRGDSILYLIFTYSDQRITCIDHCEPLEFRKQGRHILKFKYLVSSVCIKTKK